MPLKHGECRIVGRRSEGDRGVKRLAEFARGAQRFDGLSDLGTHREQGGKIVFDFDLGPRGGSIRPVLKMDGIGGILGLRDGEGPGFVGGEDEDR